MTETTENTEKQRTQGEHLNTAGIKRKERMKRTNRTRNRKIL